MPKPEIDSEDALGTGTSLVKIVSEVLEEVDPELDAAQDDLAVTIKPESIKKVCELSKFRPELDFNYLRCISVVDYIERLEINSTEQLTKNIFINNIKENIVLVKKPSFLDLESILRKTKVLITCHGALTHAAASFNIKIIDIVEESREELVKRYSLYIKNYYIVYRSFNYS